MIWRTSAKSSFGDYRPFLGFLSKEPFAQGELRECYFLWITQDQGETSGVRWVAHNSVNNGNNGSSSHANGAASSSIPFGYMRSAPHNNTYNNQNASNSASSASSFPTSSSLGKNRLFVAKRFLTLDGRDELALLKEDLFLQYKAKEIAAAYNQRNPPKPVDFVDCGIMLVRRAGETRDRLFLVEPFLEGEYVKYSNNTGWESGARATPLAFSHFSYDYSRGNLVVVDLQGVGNTYTDPGVHTRDEWWEQCEIQGSGSSVNVVPRVGPANFGDEGLEVFRTTHRCHPLCEELRLPVVNRLARLMRVTTSFDLARGEGGRGGDGREAGGLGMAKGSGGQGGAGVSGGGGGRRDQEEELEQLLFGGGGSEDGGGGGGMW